MYFKPKDIIDVAKRLHNKEVGIFPCDTIWGLIGVLDEGVMDRIYDIKQREPNRPFLLLLPHIRFLDHFIDEITQEHQELMRKYWPGPLTLIFNKKASVSDKVSAGKPTIGVRLPEFLPLNYLLLLLDKPIISTSVNLSHMPSSLDPETFPEEIVSQVDFTYTGVSPRLGTESDIVDGTVSPYKVLRKSLIFND